MVYLLYTRNQRLGSPEPSARVSNTIAPLHKVNSTLSVPRSQTQLLIVLALDILCPDVFPLPLCNCLAMNPQPTKDSYPFVDTIPDSIRANIVCAVSYQPPLHCRCSSGGLHIHLECECRCEHGSEKDVVLSEEEATYPIVLAANSIQLRYILGF